MSKEQKVPAYPQTGIATTCRSYGEYTAMFGLTEADLAKGSVLDVAGGASSFTAELRAKGIPAFAADPFYAKPTEEAISYAQSEVEAIYPKLERMKDSYDWSFYGSLEEHRNMRERSLAAFAADFRSPDAAGRYIAASLPRLPFEDGRFDLVLCSHFLFLYAESFGEDFHRKAIRELLRVAKPGGEVLIYPLINLKWEEVPYIMPIVQELSDVAEGTFETSELPFVPVPSSLLRLVKTG